MKPSLIISAGTCGLARGAEEIIEAARAHQRERHLEKKFNIKITGCHGFCEAEPNVVAQIDDRQIFYQKLKKEHVPKIIEETMIKGMIIQDLLWFDPATGKHYEDMNEIPFYQKQQRIVLGQNVVTDPKHIDDYLQAGGYAALDEVLKECHPEEVITVIKGSGLRGRGGAGFPTGRKWGICRKSKGSRKYIVCNADEGDPGAYMDRSLLEGNPHRVIEGMCIGAYAIGACAGIIYVRNEYPLAIANLTKALEQAYQRGFLGKNILKSKFSFDISIVRGAGAFVCGEETALLASIEGKVGRPRPRPPFPVEQGLWGCPTNINNVETWANVPMIVARGQEWYASIGTQGSKGTKIFSLVGKINNTGLVEVPMGTTLREIIHDIGGGIVGGKKFKAVQTGGPSGGCIPANLLDLPIDYESLTEAGSMMGSGGMIVMDEETCMVDVARYFLNFTQEESCGKCPSCRLGTRHMVKVLNRITKGHGRNEDLEFLKTIGENVKLSSLCGLGQTAANPVLTTIRYFEDEYQAHIREKRCPALVCKALISYFIDPEECRGCALCAKNCPSEAIEGVPKEVYTIDQRKCIKCGVCISVCPDKFGAVKKTSPVIK